MQRNFNNSHNRVRYGFDSCPYNEAKVFFLATVDGDKPRVRPFGAINIFEDKLYFQTGKIKDVSKQLDINPNVEICGFTDGEWIRLEGKLVKCR